MKNTFIKSIIAVFLFFIANKSSAQCPPFTHQVIVYEIDQFNFHRPKLDCQKGFFICIKGHWESRCAPNSPLYARITEKGMVEGYALVKDRQVELHLPAALADLPAYSEEDMTVFTVEKDWIEIFVDKKKIGTLKEGDYKVTKTKTELAEYYGAFINDSTEILKSKSLSKNLSCIGLVLKEINKSSHDIDDSLLLNNSRFREYRLLSLSNDKLIHINSKKGVKVFLLYGYAMGTYFDKFFKKVSTISDSQSALAIYIISVDPLQMLH